MATYQDLIDAAYVELGVYGISDTPSTAMRTAGFNVYKRMIGSWSAEIGPVFAETSETLTILAQASQTIGTGGDISTTRPMQIISAQIRESNIDEPLQIISHQEYQAIADKTTTGKPEKIAYLPTIASGYGTLKFWPTPDATYSMRLTSMKALTDPSTIVDTVTLPPGYEKAIVDNLVYELARPNGRNPGDYKQQAMESKWVIVRANEVPIEMIPDYLAPGQSLRIAYEDPVE
jgi:hypothetical protein